MRVIKSVKTLQPRKSGAGISGKTVFTIPLLLRIETKLEMCIDKDMSVSSSKNSKMFDFGCPKKYSYIFSKIIPLFLSMFLTKILSRCTIRANYVIN